MIYNPCSDGFEAKAWECLRRNDEFNDTLTLWGAKTEDDAMSALASIWAHPPGHPFLRSALGHCMGHDPEIPAIGDEGFPILSTCMPWDEIPEKVRLELEYGLIRHLPDRFSIPKMDEVSPIEDKNSFSEQKSRSFFWALSDINESHDLVAVPKFVWDNSHKKKILSEIEKMLGKPESATKLLKPTGATLGSTKLWDEYLLFEEWRILGFARQRACQLVAWERHEGESFGEFPKSRSRELTSQRRRLREARAKSFLETNRPKSPRHEHSVEKHVAEIELSIKSVFPNFAPYRTNTK